MRTATTRTTPTRQATTPYGSAIKISSEYASIKQVMQEAHLDWDVNTERLFLADGTQVPKAKVTRRSSDNKILGVVGDRYTVMQNYDALKWFQPFIDSHNATIEHAGAFKDGKVIFLQARVNRDDVEIVKGDAVRPYITLAHAHDGSLAVMAGSTLVRLFCTNQLPMLKTSKTAKLLKMRHTKNMMIGLEAVRDIMNVYTGEFIGTTDQLKFLASVGVTKKSLEKFFTLAVTVKEDDDSDKTKKVETLTRIFETGRGLGGKEMHNFYGAYNALTEFLTWDSGRTVDNRLQELWFGTAQRVSQNAMEIAMAMAGGRSGRA